MNLRHMNALVHRNQLHNNWSGNDSAHVVLCLGAAESQPKQ
jgi:hypothetical protein